MRLSKSQIGVSVAAFLLVIGIAAKVLATGVPAMPNSAPFNDPASQLQNMQMLIQQLNGLPAYAPAQIMGVGGYCSASGATPQACNAQRGLVSFTGVTVAAVSTGAVVINNSLVNAQSNCQANLNSDNSAAASFPYVRSVVSGAGTITVNISNAAAATSTGASTFGVLFNCTN